MFGGMCEETTELNDFWMLDLSTNEWTPIESLNGPSPRSGGKMVFDPSGNQIFVIGRKPMRGSESLKVSCETLRSLTYLTFNLSLERFLSL